jgi:hypothetical protein
MPTRQQGLGVCKIRNEVIASEVNLRTIDIHNSKFEFYSFFTFKLLIIFIIGY